MPLPFVLLPIIVGTAISVALICLWITLTRQGHDGPSGLLVASFIVPTIILGCWLYESATSPAEISGVTILDVQNLHQDGDSVQVVIYKDKIINLNQAMSRVISNGDRVKITRYRQYYYGIEWYIQDRFETCRGEDQ